MRRIGVVLLLILVAVGLIALGCSKAPSPSAGGPAGTARPGVSPTTVASTVDLPDRMIVRTGNMALAVGDVVATLDSVAAMATQRGGYVVSSSQEGAGADKKATISFRIAPAEFDATILALRNMATRVITESTSSQDVTQEYVDLQSRLRNLEATNGQLMSFMGRATTIDEVLKVQRELTTVQGQIEETKGRMQYLERTSAMSLINVTLLSSTSREAIVRPGWNGIEIIKSATRALVIFAQVLGGIAIWLAMFSPVWGTVVGIVWWRQRRARLNKR